MPEAYRRLLVHNHHMTVAMEEFHGGTVQVQVLQAQYVDNHYSRQILLVCQTDGRVVQFGIVRLNLDCLSLQVRQEIESQTTPLGRILIRHNVLREIELVGSWRVQPGPDLSRLFNAGLQEITYGRTAIIHCNGEPAVELLEIAAPVAE